MEQNNTSLKEVGHCRVTGIRTRSRGSSHFSGLNRSFIDNPCRDDSGWEGGPGNGTQRGYLDVDQEGVGGGGKGHVL